MLPPRFPPATCARLCALQGFHMTNTRREPTQPRHHTSDRLPLSPAQTAHTRGSVPSAGLPHDGRGFAVRVQGTWLGGWRVCGCGVGAWATVPGGQPRRRSCSAGARV
eukprot:363433-Chlamydomonas_euryale.AAC.6